MKAFLRVDARGGRGVQADLGSPATRLAVLVVLAGVLQRDRAVAAGRRRLLWAGLVAARFFLRGGNALSDHAQEEEEDLARDAARTRVS